MKYFTSILAIVAGVLIFLTKGSPDTALVILALFLVIKGIWTATNR